MARFTIPPNEMVIVSPENPSRKFYAVTCYTLNAEVTIISDMERAVAGHGFEQSTHFAIPYTGEISAVSAEEVEIEFSDS